MRVILSFTRIFTNALALTSLLDINLCIWWYFKNDQILDDITLILELGLLNTLLWTFLGDVRDVVLLSTWMVGILTFEDKIFSNYFCWLTFSVIWLWITSICSLLFIFYLNFNSYIIFSLAYFSCKSFISSIFNNSTLFDFLRASFLGLYIFYLATSIFNLLIA